MDNKVTEAPIDVRISKSLERMEAQAKVKAAKEREYAKVVTVTSARTNALKAGIWYISLSNGKILPTKSEAFYNLAVKMVAAKTAVSYKEAKDSTDGKYWLSEIKAEK